MNWAPTRWTLRQGTRDPDLGNFSLATSCICPVVCHVSNEPPNPVAKVHPKFLSAAPIQPCHHTIYKDDQAWHSFPLLLPDRELLDGNAHVSTDPGLIRHTFHMQTTLPFPHEWCRAMDTPKE